MEFITNEGRKGFEAFCKWLDKLTFKNGVNKVYVNGIYGDIVSIRWYETDCYVELAYFEKVSSLLQIEQLLTGIRQHEMNRLKYIAKSKEELL